VHSPQEKNWPIGQVIVSRGIRVLVVIVSAIGGLEYVEVAAETVAVMVAVVVVESGIGVESTSEVELVDGSKSLEGSVVVNSKEIVVESKVLTLVVAIILLLNVLCDNGVAVPTFLTVVVVDSCKEPKTVSPSCRCHFVVTNTYRACKEACFWCSYFRVFT
jgi:hypothetical protein